MLQNASVGRRLCCVALGGGRHSLQNKNPNVVVKSCDCLVLSLSKRFDVLEPSFSSKRKYAKKKKKKEEEEEEEEEEKEKKKLPFSLTSRYMLFLSFGPSHVDWSMGST